MPYRVMVVIEEYSDECPDWGVETMEETIVDNNLNESLASTMHDAIVTFAKNHKTGKEG